MAQRGSAACAFLRAAGPWAYYYRARAGETRAPPPAGGACLSFRDVRRAAGPHSTVAKWVYAMPLRLLAETRCVAGRA